MDTIKDWKPRSGPTGDGEEFISTLQRPQRKCEYGGPDSSFRLGVSIELFERQAYVDAFFQLHILAGPLWWWTNRARQQSESIALLQRERNASRPNMPVQPEGGQ
jgi:hypothetical protein